MKVYTISGNLVRTLYNGNLNGSGYLKWDGRDDNGQPVETGLYLITLKTPFSTQTRKVLAYRR